MSVKSEILAILSDTNGEFISGEALGARLYCSRNAVWKAINALKADGYEIDAVTNKGYRLLGGDVLCADSVMRYLKLPLDVQAVDCVPSTNDVLKAAAENGAKEGMVIIAKEQSKGKGRLGRSFFSPNSGIYMSILLRPKISASESLMITTCAAVAVCEAIEKVCGKNCGIKWVNDIFLNGLKVCGILTEASVDFETSGLQYAVLGIGINIAHPEKDFPSELHGIAGALYDELPKGENIRSRLCAELLNSFFGYYKSLPQREFMEQYKRRSIIVGKKIFVIQNGGKTPATALGIDDDARLLVRYDDGKTALISTGEVSVRLQKE